YEVGWGTPFDLAEIDDDEFFDRNNVRFVRLVDVIGGVDTDSQGNIIYDAQSGGWATGFDFTGLGVINQGEAYQVADFEGLLTNADSHEIISADNGTIDSEGNYRLSYLSGGLSFEALGLYDGMFACGFGPSNHTTDNQPYYSAQSLMGLENPGSTYMVGYYSDWAGTAEHNVIKREDNTAFSPIGVYVNNSSSAYSYMSSANFPQNNYFLNIIATGYDETGAITNAVSYPLADANGFVGEWKYMDLTSLGECHKVIFTLSSNDDSGYGINVPAYFCIDAFSYYNSAESSSLKEELANEFSVNVFPNPASKRTNINIKGLSNKAQITLNDIQGRTLLNDEIFESNYELNTSNMQSGVYFIKITSENIVKTQKLIVK
ncbi:MAG: DUF4465 domain-containing protein, partial [Bacteroidales bacterium]|nr:DUF4465 domain-containing protein [Bacteroidales bacterium]